MKLAKNKLEKDEPTQPQNDDKELILFKELHPNFTKGYEELSNNWFTCPAYQWWIEKVSSEWIVHGKAWYWGS